jgi:transcriptional regulator with XRE-family HTH domain
MSLRQTAKELGVSHTLLVLWKQGKRTLSPELEERYHQLVTGVTIPAAVDAAGVSTSPLLPILIGSLPGLKERRWKDSIRGRTSTDSSLGQLLANLSCNA